MKETLTAGAPFPTRRAPAADRAERIPTAKADPPHQKSRGLKDRFAAVSRHLQALGKCGDDRTRALVCSQFQRDVQALERCAAEAGRQTLARQAAALEALLNELCGKPNQVNDFRLRTLALAVEVLETLLPHPEPSQHPLRESVAVVVDADRVSCIAASNALRNAGFNPCRFSDPAAAW